MTSTEGALVLMSAGLIATVVFDFLLLSWQVVWRSERRPFRGLIFGMSRGVGRLLLAVCLPAAIITLVAIYLRSWDAGSQLTLWFALSSLGTIIGAFMASDFDAVPSRAVHVSTRPSRTSLRPSSGS